MKRPSMLDLHIYGGALCMAAGVALGVVWPPFFGISVFGATMFVLGVRR